MASLFPRRLLGRRNRATRHVHGQQIGLAAGPAVAAKPRDHDRDHITGRKAALFEPARHLDQRAGPKRALQLGQCPKRQARDMRHAVQRNLDLAAHRVCHHSATKFSAPALASAIS